MQDIAELWSNHFASLLGIGLGILLVLLGWLLLQGRRLQRAAMDADIWQRQQSEGLELALSGLEQRLEQGLVQAELRGREALHQNLERLQRATLRDAAQLRSEFQARFQQVQQVLVKELHLGRMATEQAFGNQRQTFEQRQGEALAAQLETLREGLAGLGRELREALERSAENLGGRVEGLTRTTDERLREISGQVDQRLAEGFEKTTETFGKVLEHLSRIDEAQKRITELSGNVISLQEVLTDKRSRGAFGEVQLGGLVRNLLPEGSFELQKTLSNGTRVDCLLHLPEPTGRVPIDAKFPLEAFQRLVDSGLSELERADAARQFRLDIRRHVQDISRKYLIPGETADGAVLFLPAEAVFAEIHARFPELVEEAQRARVWLVSPTTLMAVLTTARAVLKDEETRRQVHIIQDHLRYLAKDFGRFRSRMDSLARHIGQAQEDVAQVHASARKISSRFEKIERVELDELEEPDGPVPASVRLSPPAR